MSSSTPNPPFLLDENVRLELARFLKSRGLDTKMAPGRTRDSIIASLSKSEKRVVVTNDWDFCEYNDKNIFSVIFLRIPQDDPKTLIASFEKLLREFKNFQGRLILLEPNKWSDFLLAKTFDFGS